MRKNPTRPASEVTVIIPALNEERRIAEVVQFALQESSVYEVIVVDDSSTDATVARACEAGARVITSSMLGKGASMHDGLLSATTEYVVFLDGDLTGLEAGLISRLTAPLCKHDADFVKARFGRSGGRVTELTARPMLAIFFPELAHLAQPLGGIVAGRRSLLAQASYERGYGVDVGLLIDALMRGWRMSEVDIGRLEHDSQPLMDLALMANEVQRVILQRAREHGRFSVEQIGAMFEKQRQAASDLNYALVRRGRRTRFLLFDLDHVITPYSIHVALSRLMRREDAVLMAGPGKEWGSFEQSDRMAAMLRRVHRERFERVTHILPLHAGIVDAVNLARRKGFMVGVVTSGFFIVAEIMRHRIFADFAVANLLSFHNDLCDGQLRVHPAFLNQHGRAPDKTHLVRRLTESIGPDESPVVWVVGNPEREPALHAACGRSFALQGVTAVEAGSHPATGNTPYAALTTALNVLDGPTLVDS